MVASLHLMVPQWRLLPSFAAHSGVNRTSGNSRCGEFAGLTISKDSHDACVSAVGSGVRLVDDIFVELLFRPLPLISAFFKCIAVCFSSGSHRVIRSFSSFNPSYLMLSLLSVDYHYCLIIILLHVRSSTPPTVHRSSLINSPTDL